MAAGTLSMQGIVRSQLDHGVWGVFDNYFFMIVPFAVYIIAATAETNRAPFDLPEAESELVAGFHTEYSGFRWALYFLAEYANMFVVSSVAVTLFWGGWLRPFPSVAWLEMPLNVGFPVVLFVGSAGYDGAHGEEAEGPDAAVSAGAGGAGAGAMGALFIVPVVNHAGDRAVLVPAEGIRDHLHDDLVPRHLPALPLRSAHEYRVEDRDPGRHGRGADQRRVGNAASQPGRCGQLSTCPT